ncbi:hypothetical protein INR49_012237, partial [Caranx melampygus]
MTIQKQWSLPREVVMVQHILAKLHWKPTRECGFGGNASQMEQSYRIMRVRCVALCDKNYV